jgi:hypothetical protein
METVMKHFLATTSIAALLALPAAAQTVTTQTGTGAGALGVTEDTGTTAATEAEIKPKGVESETAATETMETGDAAGTDTAASEPTATDGPATLPMDAADYLATVEPDALDGVRVYDSNDEWIGEIHEIVVGADGTNQAIIDVGGFLGIGEKPVALSLADITISEEPVDVVATVRTKLTFIELPSPRRNVSLGL